MTDPIAQDAEPVYVTETLRDLDVRFNSGEQYRPNVLHVDDHLDLTSKPGWICLTFSTGEYVELNLAHIEIYAIRAFTQRREVKPAPAPQK